MKIGKNAADLRFGHSGARGGFILVGELPLSSFSRNNSSHLFRSGSRSKRAPQSKAVLQTTTGTACAFSARR
jgi:hypothetical protein